MASSESRTLFVGNLSDRVTEELIYELFLQAGPLNSVRIPHMNGRQRPFGFVEYKQEVSVPYAARLFSQTSLFGRTLKLELPKTYGRRNDTMNYSNNLMSRLGPPLNSNNPQKMLEPFISNQIPSASLHLQSYSSHKDKRLPSHMIPSPVKRRKQDSSICKNDIPDSLDIPPLVGKKEKNQKKSTEKFPDDLRTKIKRKKKTKDRKESPDKGVARGGYSDNFNDSKSYFKNAVNSFKQHCSRNNRGSYDFGSSKNKKPKHLHFNT